MIARVRQTVAGTLALMIFLFLTLDAVLFVLNRTAPEQYHDNVPEHWLAYASFTIGVIGSFVATGLGFLLAQRRHKNPIGWLFLVGTLFLYTASIAGSLRTYRRNVGDGVSVFGLQLELPELEVLDFFSTPAAILGLAAIFIFLLVLFPEGRFGSISGRVIGAIVIGLTSLTLVEFVFGPSVAGRENPLGIPWLYDLVAYRLAVLDQELSLSLLAFYLTIPLAGIFFVIRYLRSEGERRLQMKWLGVAGFLGATGVLAALVSFYTQGVFEIYILDFRWSEWTSLLYGIGFNLVPIAAAVAIFKYRLYDIDVILKRSIIFGSLAVFIGGGYIAAVVGFGSVLGGERDFVSSIAATGLVAMAFQPVRSGSERVANRLVFGRKAAPYEALIRMTEQMRAQPMERILPSLAQTVADAMGARGIRIHLLLSSGEKLEGEFVGFEAVPAPDGAFPVLRSDSIIGQVEVMKRRGESITEGDKSVVRALMPRIALALENMRLALELRDRLAQKKAQAAALQESLRRVTNATLRTRLAFQREVHGAVASSLSEIERLLPETGASSAETLRDLIDIASAKTHDALEKVREIARGIFPPLLADKGLAAAIEAEASQYEGLEVEIDESLLTSRPNAEIESSIYFCCREAIRRLAVASDVSLRILKGDGRIDFEISSKGNPQLLPHGVAMDMQDRIDALGGSLTVLKSEGELNLNQGAGVQLKGMVPTDFPS